MQLSDSQNYREFVENWTLHRHEMTPDDLDCLVKELAEQYFLIQAKLALLKEFSKIPL